MPLFVLIHSPSVGPSSWLPVAQRVRAAGCEVAVPSLLGIGETGARAAGWDDHPCGYLLFSPPYEDQAALARERGWPLRSVPGEHLHQVIDPDQVARALLDLANSA